MNRSAPKRVLKRQLQIVYDLAEEMSACDDYAIRDEDTGDNFGRDPDIVNALNAFRRTFRLKGAKVTT
jgi:hypothetical protein